MSPENPAALQKTQLQFFSAILSAFGLRAEIRKAYRSKYPTDEFIIYPDQND